MPEFTRSAEVEPERDYSASGEAWNANFPAARPEDRRQPMLQTALDPRVQNPTPAFAISLLRLERARRHVLENISIGTLRPGLSDSISETGDAYRWRAAGSCFCSIRKRRRHCQTRLRSERRPEGNAMQIRSSASLDSWSGRISNKKT